MRVNKLYVVLKQGQSIYFELKPGQAQKKHYTKLDLNCNGTLSYSPSLKK
jgi:hypothetical protein